MQIKELQKRLKEFEIEIKKLRARKHELLIRLDQINCLSKIGGNKDVTKDEY